MKNVSLPKFAIAVHEAAHVVIARHYSVPVDWVTMDHPAGYEYHPEGFSTAIRGAILVAGYNAQSLVDPLCSIERDAKEDMREFEALPMVDVERAACILNTSELLTRLWPQVEALALKLIKRGTVRFEDGPANEAVAVTKGFQAE